MIGNNEVVYQNTGRNVDGSEPESETLTTLQIAPTRATPVLRDVAPIATPTPAKTPTPAPSGSGITVNAPPPPDSARVATVVPTPRTAAPAQPTAAVRDAAAETVDEEGTKRAILWLLAIAIAYIVVRTNAGESSTWE